MSLKHLIVAPGIVKINTDKFSEGRYVDSQWIRWAQGLPQKMGGYEDLLSSTVIGAARTMLPWRDNLESKRIAIGTHRKVYVFYQDELTDITPYAILQSGTLSNKLNTNSGSASVTVNHTAHGQKAGDQVVLISDTEIGGLLIRGTYKIASITDADNFVIVASSEAGSTASNGGGSISYLYPRMALTDPFTTSSGSPVVNVEHTGHGRQAGDYVTFDDASAVGGITIDGEYAVTGVVDDDNYTITHASNASSSASGGGTVSIVYDISQGMEGSAEGFGWGVGAYGAETYGTPRADAAPATLHLRTWSFDTYGGWLVGCPRGGRIYRWDPVLGGRMAPIAGAPENAEAVFVTEFRHIVAVGAEDKRTMAWADDEDPYLWAAAVDNTANEVELQMLGDLITGIRLKNGASLIFGEDAVFSMRYSGDDFVYTITKVADTGLLGPAAVTEHDGIAYWVSDGDFHASGGGIPVSLKSDDIRQWFFENINMNQRDKVVLGTIGRYNELICFYPKSPAEEVTDYVKFNVKEQVWDVGELTRTAWLDNPIFLNPIAADSDGRIYKHEEGRNANGEALRSFITAAPFDIGDGDENLEIVGIVPDFHDLSGTLSIYLLTKYYPNDSETENGPYEATRSTTRIDTRVDGRQVGWRYESDVVDGYFRLGAVRLDIQVGGRRP
jgi:hypothetical protein